VLWGAGIASSAVATTTGVAGTRKLLGVDGG
jgi:hypothetical protein